MIKLDEEKFGDLAVCALRYCQGRQTYMVSTVIGIVTAFSLMFVAKIVI